MKTIKEGQLVRRKTKYNRPIGPYLRVIGTNRKSIYVKPVNMKDAGIILRANVYLLPQTSLITSNEMLRDLKCGKKIMVAHDCTRRWENAYKKQVKIVHFYSLKFDERASFSVEYIRKETSLGRNIIKIVIANLIE